MAAALCEEQVNALHLVGNSFKVSPLLCLLGDEPALGGYNRYALCPCLREAAAVLALHIQIEAVAVAFDDSCSYASFSEAGQEFFYEGGLACAGGRGGDGDEGHPAVDIGEPALCQPPVGGGLILKK